MHCNLLTDNLNNIIRKLIGHKPINIDLEKVLAFVFSLTQSFYRPFFSGISLRIYRSLSEVLLFLALMQITSHPFGQLYAKGTSCVQANKREGHVGAIAVRGPLKIDDRRR